jgi:copper resistance protein D
MIDPGTLRLVARGLLFAATGQLAGALLFALTIAPLPRRRRVLLWGALATAIAATGLWLFSQAALFGHQPLGQVASSGVLAITVARTRFGHVMALELALAAATVPALLLRRGVFAIVPAAAMLAALAWTGHGGDGRGVAGAVHLGADCLHLLAMGAWLGGLLPLALLLGAARGTGEEEEAAAARRAIWRFSSRCLWAVGVLAAAGTVNAWFQIASFGALFGTPYGRLLLVKIGVFLAMFALAAVNREILIPRLAGRLPGTAYGRVRRTLAPMIRNTLLIALLGGAVLAIVAVLGTMVPALHQDMDRHGGLPSHPVQSAASERSIPEPRR